MCSHTVRSVRHRDDEMRGNESYRDIGLSVTARRRNVATNQDPRRDCARCGRTRRAGLRPTRIFPWFWPPVRKQTARSCAARFVPSFRVNRRAIRPLTQECHRVYLKVLPHIVQASRAHQCQTAHRVLIAGRSVSSATSMSSQMAGPLLITTVVGASMPGQSQSMTNAVSICA